MEQDESIAQSSPFMGMFEIFRRELDEHHDRRERVIKASRDITALSKKIIFALQRIRTLPTPLPQKISTECDQKHTQIHTLLHNITPDLRGLNAWRYQRQISGGIQEYIEALSFGHYLKTQRLISMGEAQAMLGPDGGDGGVGFEVKNSAGHEGDCGITKEEIGGGGQGQHGRIMLTPEDYLLGIFDFVGEVMRFAITTMATTGRIPGRDRLTDPDSLNTNQDREMEDITQYTTQLQQPTNRTSLTDLRTLRSNLEALDMTACGGSGFGRDVDKKMEVMRTCVEKVEGAVYGMIVRGSERPKGWVPGVGDGGEERGAVESF